MAEPSRTKVFLKKNNRVREIYIQSNKCGLDVAQIYEQGNNKNILIIFQCIISSGTYKRDRKKKFLDGLFPSLNRYNILQHCSIPQNNS